MSYSNSKLATLTEFSPHYNYRAGDISKITVHHAAAVTSAKKLLNYFATQSARCSANYVIGNDGQIGLCVPEKCRAWTSGSAANDNMAVTIEVSNCDGPPDWPVSDAAWASLVKLCVDVCRRNRIRKLEYTGGPSGSLTLHRFFAATECPGPYLTIRMPGLAELVNEQLDPVRYQTVDELPQWAKPTVERLLTTDALQGTETGLDLSMDMLRTLVIVERMVRDAGT